MRITAVEVFGVECALPAPLRWGTMEVATKGGVLVRVRTDDGLEGLGEAGFSIAYLSRVAPVIRDVLAPLLIGEDPRLIARLWHRMHDATHGWGRRGIETYAVSGVDIALWDLLGKACGRPVYELLGAAHRELTAYAAPSLKPPAEAAADCARAVERGFRAVKLRVGLDADTDDRIVAAAREAVGPDVDLIVDANMSRDYRGAVDIARRYRDAYGVSWLEEPIRGRSLHEYVREHARLRAATSMPISGGESLFTRYEFVPVFEKRRPSTSCSPTPPGSAASRRRRRSRRWPRRMACAAPRTSPARRGPAWRWPPTCTCWPPSPTPRTRNTTCTTTARCSGSC